MAWATPEYKPEDYNAAARMLSKLAFPISTQDGINALEIINNWRSAHAYPLNTFQITLRNKARKIEEDVIVAQRSKRLDSIHRKLVSKPTMRLTQMQDVAGCRAIFSKLSSVRKLVAAYKNTKFDHKFRSEKDYIQHPKPDGYRCYHLVYEYIGIGNNKKYTGLRVEIQIRTQMQHAWATAVESVGIFTRQALKSNQGNQDWLRFFALMGSAIAAIEKSPSVPGTPLKKEDLINEISQLNETLHVKQMLQTYNSTLSMLGSAKDAKYFIMELDPESYQITLQRYKAKQSAEANEIYTKIESQISDSSSRQVVLVSVENINALKRAYPNYFLDTNIFSRLVERVLKGGFPDLLPPSSNLSKA